MTPQAAAKDLELVFDCGAPEALAVRIDADRVRQVLLNLIGNAVKVTKAGTVSVRLTYDQAESLMRVEVIDTGPGITGEDQGRLFKRFSQIDGSLSRQASGAGLGLAICKGLVEAMGGSIGVTSDLGRGSRFWFQIPAPISVDEASEAAARPDRIALSGVRVLVVDDHHANRDLARLCLAGVGAEVTLAEDGRQAVELAAHSPFDVILMDLRMPVLDGRGAFHAIRAGGPNVRTPMIAFTADATSRRVGPEPVAEFDGALPKPIDTIALISEVARLAETAGLTGEEDGHLRTGAVAP
jgi:CheY-like chemotaxis protein